MHKHLRIAGLLKLYCQRFWRFAIWTLFANFIRRMWNQELNFCYTVIYFKIPSSLAFFINILSQTSLAKYANNKTFLRFRAVRVTSLCHFANWKICDNIRVFIQHCIKFSTWLQLSKTKIRATIQHDLFRRLSGNAYARSNYTLKETLLQKISEVLSSEQISMISFFRTKLLTKFNTWREFV